MYIGTDTISKIYKNVTEISKIYRGETVIYSTGVTPEPPTPQIYLDFYITNGIKNTNDMIYLNPIITNIIKENV